MAAYWSVGWSGSYSIAYTVMILILHNNSHTYDLTYDCSLMTKPTHIITSLASYLLLHLGNCVTGVGPDEVCGLDSTSTGCSAHNTLRTVDCLCNDPELNTTSNCQSKCQNDPGPEEDGSVLTTTTIQGGR